jgi:hypothetical protein
MRKLEAILTTYRLHHGLLWAGKYPDLRRHFFGLFVILLLILLAGSMDYHVARSAELERIEPIKESYMQALIACINGSLRMQWGNELFVGKCEPLGSAE